MSKNKRRNCVFTSAGDNNNIRDWLSEGNRSWDLITAFYGQDKDSFRELDRASVYSEKIKGSKFQNLYKFYTENKSLFEQYDFVWVVDDDIKITPTDIEKLFNTARKWDFWVCQPSFDPAGKVSHHVTEQFSGSSIRFVDFVEVTCPLFRTDKLVNFLQEYDGGLVGWGIDYWFSFALKSNKYYKFAIIDFVQALNPHDYMKGGVREIDNVQSSVLREIHANQTLLSLGIPAKEPSNRAWVLLENDMRIIEATVCDKDLKISSLLEKIDSIEAAYAEEKNDLLYNRKLLQESKLRIDELLGSKSWRYTALLRKMAIFIRLVNIHLQRFFRRFRY